MTHTAHQGAAKNLAKCEFVLGLALLMTKTLGNAHLPHSEERLAELMLYTELTRSCMRAAEADAKLDEWGVMCTAALTAESTRNLFMTAHPRMVEILQPSARAASRSRRPPTSARPREIDSTWRPIPPLPIGSSSAWPGRRRARFGSRQVLYERFFASDPLTRARALGAIYPKDEMMDRVRDLLNDE